MKKKIILSGLALSVVLGIIGCTRESEIVSYNISRDADNFQVKRRIVFFNGITGKNIMEIIGYCSIHKDNADNQLEITCRVGKNKFKKHYFGLSDNTAYFVEQVNPAFESEFNYKVVFRPQTLIPDVTVRTSTRIAPKPKIVTTNIK